MQRSPRFRIPAMSCGMLLVCATMPWPLASVGTAQTPAPAAKPPARAHHVAVYDPAAGRVLIVGGSTPRDGGFTFFDDVWAFDGADWTRLAIAGLAQSGQRLAWDARRERVVSFGGFRERQAFGHLLQLSQSGWDSVGALPQRPTTEGGFVYDSRRDRFVLFGGAPAGAGAWGDTWELDGETWTRVNSEGPEPRLGFAMAYDSSRGVTWLFGGFGTEGNQPLGDTWAWDGRRWSLVDTAGPTPRIAPGWAWDSRRGHLVLFGGGGPGGNLSDTWTWDGAVWRQVATEGPPARMMAAMAYDPRRDRVVLFGGRSGGPDGDLDDTWEWDGEAWRPFASPGR